MTKKIDDITAGKKPRITTTIRYRKGIVINRKFRGSNDASPDTEISKGDGLILNTLIVNLIFWGKIWTSRNKPKPGYITIRNDVRQILSGSYITGLQQYGVSSASLNQSYLFDETEPPNNFRGKDVVELIEKMVEDGTLAKPDEVGGSFHCIIMPPGVVSKFGGGIDALHFTADYPGCKKKLHLAWILFGKRSFISQNFSHEFVEVCTDPEGDGIRIVSESKSSGWIEIADVCKSTKKVNGVTVQSYWSQQDAACIIPMESGSSK